MSVPVLAAVTGASWEAALVAGLERTPSGITVVRRCVDLADLLAAASTGTARGALLSAELRRLDRDALARLAAARVAVVGLYAPGDEQAETRLRQLGVVHVLPADSAARGHRRGRVRRARRPGGRRPMGVPGRRGASRSRRCPTPRSRSTPPRPSSPGPAGWSRSGARPERRAAPRSR